MKCISLTRRLKPACFSAAAAREHTQGPSAAQHVTQETIQPSTATCHLHSLLPKKSAVSLGAIWGPTPQRLEVATLAGWNLGVNVTRLRHAQKSTCVRFVGAPMSQVRSQILIVANTWRHCWAIAVSPQTAQENKFEARAKVVCPRSAQTRRMSATSFQVNCWSTSFKHNFQQGSHDQSDNGHIISKIKVGFFSRLS